MNYRNTIFLAGAIGLALLAGSTVQGCYRTEAPPDTRNAAQKAEADWFNGVAKKAEGDFNKLSPEEQQRAIKFRNGNEQDARTSISMAGKFQPK